MENKEMQVYDEVRLRVKRSRDFFREKGIGDFDYYQITEDQYQSLKNGLISLSQQFINENPNSKLNPDLNGLLKHLDCMNEVFQWLWNFPQFKEILPEQSRDNFNFIRFLVLAHDLERFIFNGPLPINYIDQVGDALNERRFFPNFPFSDFLHSIDYITGRKKPPSPDEKPLVYIFKTVDTLAKLQRDPEKFMNEEYNNWLERQIQLGRFPIKIKRYDGVFANISADEYRQRDLDFVNFGLDQIEKVTGMSRSDIFAKIKEIKFLNKMVQKKISEKNFKDVYIIIPAYNEEKIKYIVPPRCFL
ncbi:MAG: hypothetical protein KatS3mg092_0522 [Patescibacteria group bacterium]|nr:MAG: hypothetical protein KatS3mg092_0522 [Patescibacteria group bacterium]